MNKLPNDNISIIIMTAMWGLLGGIVVVLMYIGALYFMSLTGNIVVMIIGYIVPGIVLYLFSLLGKKFNARMDFTCSVALLGGYFGMTSFLNGLTESLLTNSVANDIALVFTGISALIILVILGIKTFKAKKRGKV